MGLCVVGTATIRTNARKGRCCTLSVSNTLTDLGSVCTWSLQWKLIGDVCTRSAGQSAQDSLTERDLAKLSGLLTFGSPLDKVYYFFREHVRKDQAIRAQLLSYIHPFRRKSSWRDYGTYKFEKYEVPDLKVRWSNVWCPLDPVSGHLDFYNVDAQSLLWYGFRVLPTSPMRRISAFTTS
jgi:hypothetical protein